MNSGFAETLVDQPRIGKQRVWFSWKVFLRYHIGLQIAQLLSI
jgi:hypothetical protein